MTKNQKATCATCAWFFLDDPFVGYGLCELDPKPVEKSPRSHCRHHSDGVAPLPAQPLALANLLLYCSFCGKCQTEIEKLIAGPSVFICNECVDLCNGIISEESAAKPTAG